MYIIVGGSGFLGSYTIKELLKDTNEEIVSISRSGLCAFKDARITTEKCDLRDYASVRGLAKKYNRAHDARILYLAACHMVDFVQFNPEDAAKVNIDALDNFVFEFSDSSGFLFSSSDTVYGEGDNSGKFSEDDMLNPVNEYGVQKMKAESIVSEAGGTSLRLSFLMGKSLLPGRKHFCDYILESICNGKNFAMYTDSFRNISDYSTVSDCIVKLFNADIPLPSVINLCSDELLSKYEFGLRLADAVGVDKELILPSETPYNPDKAPRSACTYMDNTLVKKILGVKSISNDYSIFTGD